MKRLARAFALFGTAFTLAFCATAPGGAATAPSVFYVAPAGSAAGDGTPAHPWDLQTALNQPASVHPGDTIWLRGGVYAGRFTSALNGTLDQPIVVRQVPGERATIDGGNSDGQAILTINGSYTWFWGFEVMSSDPVRVSSQPGSWPTDLPRGDGIDSGTGASPGIRLINLVIHDTRQGVSAFSAWSDTEISGCLIYYNGWQSAAAGAVPTGHGHGIYTQNQFGSKRIVGNILFSGFGHGIHAYGSSSAFLDNFTIEGNTIFVSGTLEDQNARNLLLGGSSVAVNPAVVGNLLYRSGADMPASDLDLGYAAGCLNATMTGNYIASNAYFVNCLPATFHGNAFVGRITGLTTGAGPDNSVAAGKPTGVRTFVRSNDYELGRANVTVYNWDLQDSVSVDLSGVLATGDEFEIRNAADFFGAPVVTGSYTGAPVAIPMTGLSVASPVGWPAPRPTGPEFNAFVVLTTRSARDQPVRPGEQPVTGAHVIDRPAKELPGLALGRDPQGSTRRTAASRAGLGHRADLSRRLARRAPHAQIGLGQERVQELAHRGPVALARELLEDAQRPLDLLGRVRVRAFR